MQICGKDFFVSRDDIQDAKTEIVEWLNEMSCRQTGHGILFLWAVETGSIMTEMTQVLRKAVELGYLYFDTAECYTGENPDGSTAYNEELVGKALKPYRGDVVIATKFGVRHSPDGLLTDSSPNTIRESVRGSLKRLDAEYIDLYYQHRIDPNVSPEEVAGVMKELMAEGLIRHWGISEANEEYIRKAHSDMKISEVFGGTKSVK